ncbi:MAG: hypothetical protein U0992_08185 [Planctomycetaceae bacterium]
MKQASIQSVAVNGSNLTVRGVYDTDGDTLKSLRLDVWLDDRNIGSVTNTAPGPSQQIEVRSDNHDLRKADWIVVSDVKGTTEANDLWQVSIVSPDRVILLGSIYEHAYAGNTGSWQLVRAARRPQSFSPAQVPPAWEVTISLTRNGWYSVQAACFFPKAPHVAASSEFQVPTRVG